MSKSTKGKIILSEDDPDAREIAKIILELNGFEVIEADSGIEVESRAYEEPPVAIILDLSIAGGGINTMQRLRKLFREKTFPILAFTALSSADEQENLKREGFDGVIPKPCHPEKIVNIVMKHIKE